MSRDILADFLTEHGSEVENMLLHEWKLEEALEVRYEEGMEEGMEKGVSIGHKEVFALLERGVPLAEAKRMLGQCRAMAAK